MSEPALTQSLSGWGRYPVGECHVYRPEKRISAAAIFSEKKQAQYIPRGMGKSYGDPAVNFGGGVISSLRLDRMLDFDPSTGILHCESGIRFDTLIDTFLPRGFFIPVTPGTKLITVGGAIGNDVHGKNHHRDGSFGNAVLEIELLVPSGEILHCSREENSDVFWATIGGVGLTGFILSARFRLQRVESAYIVADYVKTQDLDGVLSAIAESDEKYQYSMAWVDALAKGKRLGRAVLMLGNHAKPADLPRGGDDPFNANLRPQLPMPMDLPGFTLNRLSIKAFNTLFYATSSGSAGKLVDYNRYFFPLDFIGNWNRMYGKRGFVQYQITVPLSEHDALVEVLETLRSTGHSSFLTVLKKFGPGNEGMLSHPFEGYTLTLDIAMYKGLPDFLRELDKKVLDHGGRLYLAKDAVMTPETFREGYPRLDEFLAVRARLDPDNVLASTMARRLGLAKDSRANGGS